MSGMHRRIVHHPDAPVLLERPDVHDIGTLAHLIQAVAANA